MEISCLYILITEHLLLIFDSALSASQVTALYNESQIIESTDGIDSILQFTGGTGTITFS